MKKKKIEPLPPTGSFPGYNRGAAVFNTWAQALLDQSAVMNDLWSKLKGGNLKADQGVKALIGTLEYTAGSMEDIFEAIVSGKRPKPRKAPAAGGRRKKRGRRPAKGKRPAKRRRK